jgi:flagellar assembly protein FliH
MLPQTITFSRPLRDVRIAPPATAAEWEKRLGEREQGGYERGRLDGERALSEQLLRQRNEMLQLHRGVIDSLRQAIPRVIQDAETALAAIALEAAGRLVAGLPISAEMVEACVREAMAQAEEAVEFQIFVHPEDLALLQQHSSPLVSATKEAAKLHFHASPDVTRGGCLVETRFGTIDARRETKLQQLEKALTA